MFKPVESVRTARYNSPISHDFLDMYEAALDRSILEAESKTPSRTFAPSQVRCKRVSWFRLRGVDPEPEVVVNRGLNFTAQIGTACHQTIQEILSNELGEDWLDVEAYMRSANLPYVYTCTKNQYETQIEITDPVPIKFAPDGIFRYKGVTWLLEIKTSEYSSFEKLTGPKPNHIDQITCYSTILNISNVLVMYQDRVHGDRKCYEVFIPEKDMKATWDMLYEVKDYADKNIAPPRPEDRKYCSPSYCRYYNRCKEW